MLDTASQRPATGMDGGAPQLILNTLEGCPECLVMDGFLRDACPDLGDYVSAVGRVWGEDVAADLAHELTARASQMSTAPSFGDAYRKDEDIANALLLNMPEPDYRLAVKVAVQERKLAANPVARINEICQRRGIPWELTAADGFAWVGDAEVEELAIRPAISAIDDPRLTGARDHFNTARSELATGTPTALRQCVLESACAVESAMKAVLSGRGVE